MAKLADDQPIALRKKRRSSSVYTNTRNPSPGSAAVKHAPADSHAMETPARPKKKVRFSDPGPLLSTGITPFLQRTSFEFPSRSPPPRGSPEPRSRSTSRSSKPSGTRYSLPAASSAPWLGGQVEGKPIEFSFTPLRQALTPRAVRQLKRRYLSQEMNDIDSDMKLALKQDKRIQELENDLKVTRETAKQDQVSPSSLKRMHELEAEIDDLRCRLRARPTTPAPMTPSEIYDQMDLVDPGSPCPTIPFSDDMGYEVPSPTSSLEPRTPTVGAAVQADLPHPELLALQKQSETQKQHLIDARMELERLIPGETALPLSPTLDCDVSPMLSALLNHLRSAMTEVNRAQKLLKASEAQEAKLRTEFNKSLKHFESARSYNKLLEGNLGKVNKIFTDVKAKATDRLDKANRQIRELQQEKKESEHSISSLTNALDKYRADVKDLEDLITNMESKHSRMLSRLSKAHEQRVSDLEAHVDAETRGRREAEDEVEDLELRVAEVEVLNRELKQAMHQKQKTLREMEAEWEQQREHLEKEVGGLNVRLSETQGKVCELQEQVAVERKRTHEAVGKVVESARMAGEEAVREAAPDQDGRVSFGLLTPQVDGGRFVDIVGSHVDGHVENRRGKASKKRKHPDSGIGILEEDESEILSSDL